MKKKHGTLLIYKTARGEWRWQLALSKKVIGASTEGYRNRKACMANFEKISGIALWHRKGERGNFKFEIYFTLRAAGQVSL